MASIVIDGVEYAPVSESSSAAKVDDLDLVIVRSATASPFIGYLDEFDGEAKTARLKRARRIRYWKGAMDLSQLANDGTSNPGECQFSAESGQDKIVLNVNEVHYVSEAARKTFDEVKAWEV